MHARSRTSSCFRALSSGDQQAEQVLHVLHGLIKPRAWESAARNASREL